MGEDFVFPLRILEFFVFVFLFNYIYISYCAQFQQHLLTGPSSRETGGPLTNPLCQLIQLTQKQIIILIFIPKSLCHHTTFPHLTETEKHHRHFLLKQLAKSMSHQPFSQKSESDILDIQVVPQGIFSLFLLQCLSLACTTVHARCPGLTLLR